MFSGVKVLSGIIAIIQDSHIDFLSYFHVMYWNSREIKRRLLESSLPIFVVVRKLKSMKVPLTQGVMVYGILSTSIQTIRSGV